MLPDIDFDPPVRTSHPRTTHSGAYMELLGPIGVFSVIILLSLYVFETLSGHTWSGVSPPVPLVDILRDWLVYMALFIGLDMILSDPVALAGSGVLQCIFVGFPGNKGQLSPAA